MLDDNDKLEQMVYEASKRAHKGRLERLRFLLSQEDQNPAPVEALAYEYYQEARLCWHMGAYVAVILMSQLALEEMLRSHYRVANGVSGNL